jgi:hypothetical protein
VATLGRPFVRIALASFAEAPLLTMDGHRPALYPGAQAISRPSLQQPASASLLPSSPDFGRATGRWRYAIGIDRRRVIRRPRPARVFRRESRRSGQIPIGILGRRLAGVDFGRRRLSRFGWVGHATLLLSAENTKVAVTRIRVRQLRIVDRAVALVRISLGSFSGRCIRRRWLLTG